MKRKIILIAILFIILSILAFFVFFPFESLIKKNIENYLGKNISIKKIKIKWNYVYAEEIVMKTPSGEDFLKIKELKIQLYLLSLLRKKFDFGEIHLESPYLYLKRSKKGLWQIPMLKKEEQKEPVNFYFKEFKVTDGIIRIEDELKRFDLQLIDFKMSIKNRSSFAGEIDISAEGKCNEGGIIKLKSEGNLNEENFTGNLVINDLNIQVLRPYIRGDVTIKKGYLSLNSNFIVNKGYVKAPSILKAKAMEIESKGFFMGISAPVLIKLLEKKGEIVISFNIWGRWDNLQTDLEKAIKAEISEELGKRITSPIGTIIKPLEKIF